LSFHPPAIGRGTFVLGLRPARPTTSRANVVPAPRAGAQRPEVGLHVLARRQHGSTVWTEGKVNQPAYVALKPQRFPTRGDHAHSACKDIPFENGVDPVFRSFPFNHPGIFGGASWTNFISIDGAGDEHRLRSVGGEYLGDPTLAMAVLNRIVDGAIFLKIAGRSCRAHLARPGKAVPNQDG